MNGNFPAMTSKSIILHLKNHLSLEEVMKIYGFDDVETFRKALQKVINIPRECQKCFNELKENSKKQHKASEKQAAKARDSAAEEAKVQTTDTKKVVEKADIAPKNALQEAAADTPVTAEVTPSHKTEKGSDALNTTGISSVDRLQQLLKAEDSESKRCLKLEDEHKKLANSHRNIRDVLARKNEELEGIMRRITSIANDVESLEETYTSISNRMLEKAAEVTRVKANLQHIRIQIGALKKVSVLVASDHIEVEGNFEMPKFSDEELMPKVQVLFQRPEAEELTKKELKVIASLMSLVKIFEADKRDYEILFIDCNELEKFYHSM